MILGSRGPSSQSYGFSSSHVWMWELDYKESWEPKNWCFWTVVLEKTLDGPLDCKEIQPVHPKRNQSWIFIGRTDAVAETLILWPPNVKNWLIWKDPDAGKDWRQEEKGTTEEEMVGWHHWLDGHEFEQALGVGDRQGSLVCTVHGVAKSQTWLSDWTELRLPRAGARKMVDRLGCVPHKGQTPRLNGVPKGVGIRRKVHHRVLGSQRTWRDCLGEKQ